MLRLLDVVPKIRSRRPTKHIDVVLVLFQCSNSILGRASRQIIMLEPTRGSDE